MAEFNPKPHPLKKANIFSRITAHWVSTFLKDRGKDPWQQEKHYELPKVDLPEIHKEKLKKCIEKKKCGVISALLRVYWFECLYIFIMILIYTLMNYSSAFVLKEAVDMISSFKKEDLTKKENMAKLLGSFAYISLLSPLSEILYRWVGFTTQRISIWMKTALTLLVFDKVTKINTLNSSEFSTGRIVNYVQVDVSKLDYGPVALAGLTLNIVGIISTISVMLYLIGRALFVMLGIVLFNWFLFAIIFSIYQKANNKFLARKDTRMNFLKNLIKNIKYIKMRAYENFFQYKICKLRDMELNSLRIKLAMLVLIIFMNWVNPNTSLLSVILSYCFLDIKGFSFGKFIGFLRVYSLFQNVMRSMPFFLTVSIDLVISMNRVSKFLKSEEQDISFIKEKAPIKNLEILAPEISQPEAGKLHIMEELSQEHHEDEDIALEMRQISFFWNKQPQKLTKKEKRKQKKKIKNLAKKKKKENTNYKTSLLSSNSSFQRQLGNESTLSEGLLSTKPELSTKNPDEEKKSFELKNINLKIEKGKLVFIIGQIGSGKSSLLYSILGEMSKKKDSTGSITRNGKTAFLSQSCWILSKSLKENIILDSELDELKLAEAVKLSQFDEDLSLMQDGIDTIIGEDGQTLSGGQRTRLVLARCFYQE